MTLNGIQNFYRGAAAPALSEATDMTIIGELCIQKGGIRQFFTTKNTLTPPERIDLSLVEGPFKSLGGHWRFEAVGSDACRVCLDLEFEFAGRLIAVAIGAYSRKLLAAWLMHSAIVRISFMDNDS